MNCPLCGSKPSYVGLFKIECSNSLCENSPNKEKCPNKEKLGLRMDTLYAYYHPDQLPEIDLSIESILAKNKPNKNGDVFASSSMKDIIDHWDKMLFEKVNIENDNIERERNLGMTMGFYLLEMCDELWAFIDSMDEISEGMQKEIGYAHDKGIPVKYIMPVLIEDIDKIERHTLYDLKNKPLGHNFNSVIYCQNCQKLIWIKGGSVKPSLFGGLWGRELTTNNPDNCCKCGYVDEDLLKVSGGPSTTFGFGQEIWVRK